MTDLHPYPPPPIDDFTGLTAVITGGGSGIGRELTRQLAAQGCSVALCDTAQDAMDETIAAAIQAAIDHGRNAARFTGFIADVADASAMDAFAEHVRFEFRTEHVDLLFNNAGIGGGGSLIETSVPAWNRTFDTNWGGVLNGCRSFIHLLAASTRAQIINTASINAMWACLGPTGPHTAYSAAKAAVKAFTEALMVDFRVNAPHLTAALVMPGVVGTPIMRNSYLAFGWDPDALTEQQVRDMRLDLAKRGIDVASSDEIRRLVAQHVTGFEQAAPTTAAEAAATILDGIRRGEWRILVGADAHALDEQLRANPNDAYGDAFHTRLTEQGYFTDLTID